jgi:cellulose synthase/poly-beta-1,6-N-acetylglucosamine synthase-like glycosyltransferase
MPHKIEVTNLNLLFPFFCMNIYIKIKIYSREEFGLDFVNKNLKNNNNKRVSFMIFLIVQI